MWRHTTWDYETYGILWEWETTVEEVLLLTATHVTVHNSKYDRQSFTTAALKKAHR